MTLLTGTLVVEETLEGSLVEVVQEFFDTYGVDPETVDGKGYVGTCDGCGAVILDDENYAESDEDEIRCNKCLEQPVPPETESIVSAPAEDPEDA
jgi:hypothetical protein